MSLRQAFGTLTPVIFFRCKHDHHVLAPYSECPTPAGCEYQHPLTAVRCGQPCIREGAGTLADIDRLQSQLTSQENEKLMLERQFDVMQISAGQERVRQSLLTRLESAATPEMEKEFIREYLRLRQDLRGKHHAKFAEYSVYIHARENDLGKRGADEEKS
jgi:hypothetical protein